MAAAIGSLIEAFFEVVFEFVFSAIGYSVRRFLGFGSAMAPNADTLIGAIVVIAFVSGAVVLIF